MESYTIVFLSIGTLMFLIGFCVLIKFFSLYAEARKSSNWPEIQAKIVKSGIKTDEREVGQGDSRHFTTVYQPDIMYEYEVEGKKYASKNLYTRSFTRWYYDRDEAEQLLAKYPLNSKIPVFYNPKNPNYVAIIPGVRAQMPTLLAALVFLILGVSFLYVGVMTILDPNFIYTIDDPSYGE